MRTGARTRSDQVQLWDRFRLTLPDHDIWSDIQAIQSAARLRPNAVEVVEAEGRRAASLRHSPLRGRRTVRTLPRGRPSCSPRSTSPQDAPSPTPLPLTPSQLPEDSPILACGQKRSSSDSDGPTSSLAKRMRKQQGPAGQQLHCPGPALPPAPAAPLPSTDPFSAAGAWEQQAASLRPGGLPWRLPPTVPGVLPALQHTGGRWDCGRGEGLRGGLAGAAAAPGPQALLQEQVAGTQGQPAPWVSVVGSLLEMMQRCSTPLAEEWASAEAAGVEGMPSGQLTSALAGLLQQAAAAVGVPSQAAPAAAVPALMGSGPAAAAADRVALHVVAPMQIVLKKQQAARDAVMGMDPCSLQRQKAALAMLAVQHGLA